MTDFKRYCKTFDKFLGALKRRGMGYEQEILENGDVQLSFFYLGLIYKEHGYLLWHTGEYGIKAAFLEAYGAAIGALKEHEKNYKHGAFIRTEE